MHPGFHSAIYEGVVNHHRFRPRQHFFSYQVAMVYLDLDELDAVFALSSLWSLERRNLVSLWRRDYHGQTDRTLKEAVMDRVKSVTGTSYPARVRMLTNLRHFGYLINPMTCYYCFDEHEQLRHVVVEVTNTPWRQRQTYVLPGSAGANGDAVKFSKQMHVSPFMEMDMQYAWWHNQPAAELGIRIANHDRSGCLFSASMQLHRTALTRRAVHAFILRYPFMTAKVACGIYWQALRLWLKGVVVKPHPGQVITDDKLENERRAGS